jgi:hypothetical protein
MSESRPGEPNPRASGPSLKNLTFPAPFLTQARGQRAETDGQHKPSDFPLKER